MSGLLCLLLIREGSAVLIEDAPVGEQAHAKTSAGVDSPNGSALRDRTGGPEMGEGFAKGAFSVEVKLSRAFGTTDMGSRVSHDLWLTQLQAGWMLTDVIEPDYWFGGNIEGLGQLLAGGADHPEGAYFVGLNGGLRYHFRTGTRVDPFIAGYFGVSSTDIGDPDLSGTFQFNESIGAGARYFVSPNYAITLDYALWHVSNGGRSDPNYGVTAHVVSVGFGWIF